MPKPILKSASRQPALEVEVVSDSPAITTAKSEPWQRVRHYVDLAGLHLAASTGSQVMAGMELLQLHQSYKGRGRRNDLNVFHDERSWGAAVKEEIGVSEATAWRWMEMGKQARKRLAKDSTDLAALIDTPPSALTTDERDALKRAVHKITDGATQTELMLEWGITKAPQGSAAKGGALGKGHKAPDSQPSPAEAAAEVARTKTERLQNLLDEALKDRPFNAAPQAQRKALHGLLVDLTAAVKETL
ncbi:hypothetical protein [Actomonas aquatica]|uniref:Terminase n=1 Tax=Actomonas aquatica TaxID=2866162 RepID=A0ABZ1CCJ0_9BACT|nr:hypothetical protein [Opitutus sp. WL0086]WRQ89382.1 hypothetical protein K1X11_008170 [Opitutus sp. WL0086]